MKLDDQSKLQRLLKIKNHIYICGTSFSDFTKHPVTFVIETLSCATTIETPYFGVDFPDVCIYCGPGKNLSAKDSTLFPQCNIAQVVGNNDGNVKLQKKMLKKRKNDFSVYFRYFVYFRVG